LLYYFAFVDHGEAGTKQLTAKQLFLIELKPGITRKQFFERRNDITSKQVNLKHTLFSLLGERDGRLVLIMLIESRLKTDLLEIYNADFVSQLKTFFGDNAVYSTTVLDITAPLRILHNYLPMFNMKDGIIKTDWSKDNIFVEL